MMGWPVLWGVVWSGMVCVVNMVNVVTVASVVTGEGRGKVWSGACDLVRFGVVSVMYLMLFGQVSQLNCLVRVILLVWYQRC